ncbi:hypothetical protein D3C76_1821210 [compost metagenome]
MYRRHIKLEISGMHNIACWGLKKDTKTIRYTMAGCEKGNLDSSQRNAGVSIDRMQVRLAQQPMLLQF